MSTALQLVDAMISELETAVGKKAAASAAAPSSSSNSNEKKQKKESNNRPAKSAAPAAAATIDEINVNSLDFRVGQIVSVKKHETADKLYCEMIDVGEAEPRAIASGLVHHYTLEQMMGKRLIVVCNLKPRSLVGFKSNGMVLCAATKNEAAASGETVEFVDPPADAAIGERVIGEGLTNAPVSASQCDKKKVFETIGADLRVNEDGVAMWKDIRLVTEKTNQTCTTPTIRNGPVR